MQQIYARVSDRTPKLYVTALLSIVVINYMGFFFRYFTAASTGSVDPTGLIVFMIWMFAVHIPYLYDVVLVLQKSQPLLLVFTWLL